MGEKIDIVEVLLKKEYENDEIYDAMDHILEENKKLKEKISEGENAKRKLDDNVMLCQQLTSKLLGL